VPLHDADGIIVAWAVKDVKARFTAQLKEYVKNGGKGCEVQYKHGGDNFSYFDFYKRSWPCEQYVLVLMLPGTSPNSTKNCTPLAFAHRQMETRWLMQIIMGHIDHQLPRGDDKIEVDGQVFTFVDFFMSDRALADYVYGLDGVQCLSPCLRCFGRFGPHVVKQLASARGMTRTTEVTDALSDCAHRHRDMDALSKSAKLQAMKDDMVVQAQLKEVRAGTEAGAYTRPLIPPSETPSDTA